MYAGLAYDQNTTKLTLPPQIMSIKVYHHSILATDGSITNYTVTNGEIVSSTEMQLPAYIIFEVVYNVVHNS